MKIALSAKVSACFIAFSLVVAFSQGKKPLTADDLIQMKKAGFDEQTMVKAIETNGAAVDTSAQGLMALKSAGLGDPVIRAALSAASPVLTPSPADATPVGMAPDELGVYLSRDGRLIPLKVEILSFKTTGRLRTMGTLGISKESYNGTVVGTKSQTQVSVPVALVLRCQDGTNPAEYQLVMLDPTKGRRQFTAGKGGLTGVSLGVGEIAIPVKFERTARNVYKALLTDLKTGEYGILPPGALPTPPVTSGKIYTFGIQ